MGRSRFTPASSGGKWLRPTTRRAILLRDDFRCVYCTRSRCEHPGLRLTIDHYQPVEAGGSNEPSNLHAACIQCNSQKQGKLPRDWWAQLRARGVPAQEVERRQRRAARRRAVDLAPYRVVARAQLVDERVAKPEAPLRLTASA